MGGPGHLAFDGLNQRGERQNPEAHTLGVLQGELHRLGQRGVLGPHVLRQFGPSRGDPEHHVWEVGLVENFGVLLHELFEAERYCSNLDQSFASAGDQNCHPDGEISTPQLFRMLPGDHLLAALLILEVGDDWHMVGRLSVSREIASRQREIKGVEVKD